MESVDEKNPPVISLFQTIKNIVRFVKNPIPVLNEYLKEAGETFCLYLGISNTAMVTTNPHLIQYVLQKNHRNFQKSPLQTDQLAYYIGNGLLTANGPYWLQQRRLIQPGFHRAKLEGLSQIMLQEIDQYIEQLQVRIDRENMVDMSQEMMELTFTIVAKSLFSTNVEKSTLNRLSVNFNRIQAFMVRKIRQPFLNGWFKLSGEQKKHEVISNELRSIIADIIQTRKSSKEEHHDLLDMLLSTRYEDSGEGMTDKQLVDECLILFVAGHETSANALAWTWYLLCKHPEVVQKIRDEIHTQTLEQPLGFDTLAGLTYLNWVIQEAMRLYPPAWILERIPIEEDEFEGLPLPKDRIIGMYVYGVHHSEAYWPEPEKFDPLRFSKEASKKRPAFAYIPFGSGPRLCIGSNFAMIEMQMTLARMIMNFDFELVDEAKIELEPLITLRPKGGIPVKLRKDIFLANNANEILG